ncbi:MAG: hypothetical protein RLY20_2326 [Verrucomicrobiota bacterium]
MGLFQRDKEKDRFYLLPGMGGKAMRRKRNGMLLWATLAGIFVGGALAGILYLINSR